MTKETVEKKYEEILAEKGADECAAIIVDLPGGTPFNAAMRIVAEHKNIQLVPGLCQQLLVLLNSGESLGRRDRPDRGDLCGHLREGRRGQGC